MSEFFHNLSMQILKKSGDTFLVKFDAINKLNNSLNNLLTAKAMVFHTERVSRVTACFDQPVSVSDEQIVNDRIEKDIVRNSLNDEKIDFPTNTDHISLPNIAEKIKQQSINGNKLFVETELKRNKRDFET